MALEIFRSHQHWYNYWIVLSSSSHHRNKIFFMMKKKFLLTKYFFGENELKRLRKNLRWKKNHREKKNFSDKKKFSVKYFSVAMLIDHHVDRSVHYKIFSSLSRVVKKILCRDSIIFTGGPKNGRFGPIYTPPPPLFCFYINAYFFAVTIKSCTLNSFKNTTCAPSRR